MFRIEINTTHPNTGKLGWCPLNKLTQHTKRAAENALKTCIRSRPSLEDNLRAAWFLHPSDLRRPVFRDNRIVIVDITPDEARKLQGAA